MDTGTGANVKRQQEHGRARAKLAQRALEASFGSFLRLSIAIPGRDAPWEPDVLCERNSATQMVCSMEATTENFQALFDLVRATWGEEERRRRPTVERTDPSEGPRGLPGARSYNVPSRGGRVLKTRTDRFSPRTGKRIYQQTFTRTKEEGDEESGHGHEEEAATQPRVKRPRQARATRQSRRPPRKGLGLAGPSVATEAARRLQGDPTPA